MSINTKKVKPTFRPTNKQLKQKPTNPTIPEELATWGKAMRAELTAVKKAVANNEITVQAGIFRLEPCITLMRETVATFEEGGISVECIQYVLDIQKDTATTQQILQEFHDHLKPHFTKAPNYPNHYGGYGYGGF